MHILCRDIHYPISGCDALRVIGKLLLQNVVSRVESSIHPNVNDFFSIDLLIVNWYSHLDFICTSIYLFSWGPPRVKVRGGAKEVGLSVRLECYQ